MTNILLSIATVAALLLMYGALRLWRRDGAGRQPLLMVITALVILTNIAILTIPNNDGNALINIK
jgi:hypothetical protein